MKILFCQWGSICELDMEAGMKEAGIHVEILSGKIKSVDYDKEYLSRLSDRMMETSYDAVFSVNFMPIISRVCNVFHVPYISWTVDSPLFQLYSETVAYSCNRIFLFDEVLYQEFVHRNPEHIYYLPLAANVKHLDESIPTKEQQQQFTTDVSFIGSLYKEKCKYNQIESLPDYVRGYLEGIMEAQLLVYGYNFLEEALTDSVVQSFKQCVGWYPLGADYEENDCAIVAQEYIGVKCSELERERALNRLAEECNVDLYTLSDTSSLTGVHVKGPAHSRLQMPQIFKCSKINLNITAKTIKTGLSQRIFDILGAGGFLITNYQTEIPYYFEIGEDLVVYENIEDLVSKCHYYLEHEEERKRIARNGYEKVKQYHTFAHRFEEIIKKI